MKFLSRIRNPNLRIGLLTGGIVVGMVGASFAAVPFYRWFCQVTGYGGKPSVATVAPDDILDQTIRVRFDGSLDSEMEWSFRPVEREMIMRIGEEGLAFYEAHNPTDRPIAGQATYNVTPVSAGNFFAKIECFCFTEQVLMPGETVLMPVSFYVDPAIVNHEQAKHINTITLGYTFYEIDLPEEVQAALIPVAAPAEPLTDVTPAATQIR